MESSPDAKGAKPEIRSVPLIIPGVELGVRFVRLVREEQLDLISQTGHAVGGKPEIPKPQQVRANGEEPARAVCLNLG
jgi:hypothetical protein